jgi:predicted DNA-binding WGR domain protein
MSGGDDASRQQAQATLREMEANEDTAYEEAEKLLDEKQKTRARELVSQQREERMRARESMHGRTPPPEA